MNEDSNDLRCLQEDFDYLKSNFDELTNNYTISKSRIDFLEARECERSEAELTDKLDMVKDEYKQLKSETSKRIKEITTSKVKSDQEAEKIRNEYNVLKSHADLITEDNKALRVSAQNLDTVRGQMNDIRQVLARHGKKLPKEVYEVYAKYFNNENKK